MAELVKVQVNFVHGDKSTSRDHYFARVPMTGETIQTYDGAVFYKVQEVLLIAYDGANIASAHAPAIIEVVPAD